MNTLYLTKPLGLRHTPAAWLHGKSLSLRQPIFRKGRTRIECRVAPKIVKVNRLSSICCLLMFACLSLALPDFFLVDVNEQVHTATHLLHVGEQCIKKI